MRSLLFAALIVAAPAAAQEKDEAGARAAVNHYLAGHATGSADEFRAAFYPKGMLYWNKDGAFAERTMVDYIAGAPGKPAADEARRRRSIESLDVTGDAAMAKVVLDYPDVRFTDYLSLVKADGAWRIVNKIFNVERKTP